MSRLRNRLMSMTSLSLRHSEGASAGFKGGSVVSAVAGPAGSARTQVINKMLAISRLCMIFLFTDFPSEGLSSVTFGFRYVCLE